MKTSLILTIILLNFFAANCRPNQKVKWSNMVGTSIQLGVSQVKKNFKDSQKICEQQGGSLLAVENAPLVMYRYDTKGNFRINGYKDQSNEWKNSDGEVIDVSDIYIFSERYNRGSISISSAHKMYYGFASVSKQLRFLCEKPQEMPAEPITSCPENVMTPADFDNNMFLGDWYRYSGIPTGFSLESSQCIKETYGYNGVGTTVHIVQNSETGEYQEICGVATQDNPSALGEYTTIFNFMGTPLPPVLYYILDTDYTSYASVYSCRLIGPTVVEEAFVYTRKQRPSYKTAKIALNAYKKQGLFSALAKMVKVEHNNVCDLNNPYPQSCTEIF